MYYGRILAVVGILYFGMQLISGAITCRNEFCPGDNEKDYVYEVTDASGKSSIVVDGIRYTTDEYAEIQKKVDQ
jgi:hypothetical protein